MRAAEDLPPPQPTGALRIVGGQESGTPIAKPERPRPKGGALGIRSVVALVVLLPLLTITVIAGAGVSNSWSNRADAQTVEHDVATLAAVVQDRLQYDRAASTIIIYGGGNALGLTPKQTDVLLSVEASGQVPPQSQAIALLDQNPLLGSSRVLSEDRARNALLLSKIYSAPFGVAEAVTAVAATGNDINDVWVKDFAVLQHDIKGLQNAGAFAVDVASLRQVWVAFDAGVYQAYEATMVPAGLGTTAVDGEPIGMDLQRRTAIFESAAAQFTSELTPGEARAWQNLQLDPNATAFRSVIAESLRLVSSGIPPKATVSVLTTLSQIRGSLAYITDDGALVDAAAVDVGNEANQLVAQTTGDLIRLSAILFAVLFISVTGVIVSGSVLTRPIRALERAAFRVYQGDFDVHSLQPSGPREVRTATAAFNDMASTLKAVEAKAMALADEDINRSELYTPLPGRTGMALQAAVDHLSNSIEAREAARHDMYQAATHDRLTKLPNRLHFRERATYALSASRRNSTPLALLFLDLDDFRDVNNRYGHAAGDRALCLVANRLIASVREPDMVARMGGDEFAVILESTLADDTLAHVAKRVMENLSAPMEVEGHLFSVTASAGLVLSSGHEPVDALVRQVHEATRRAKVGGKARFTIAGGEWH